MAANPPIPQQKIDEIVELTRHSTPDSQTHWSCRTMAAKAGVSPATVQRVWAARGLKPHLVETLRLSEQPEVRGETDRCRSVSTSVLPEKAIVLCMDEKSSVQALDRTQPSLPMKPGRAQTMTHDYQRNGTATLFAVKELIASPAAPAAAGTSGVSRHWLTAWSATRPRATLARMSWAVAVHTNRLQDHFYARRGSPRSWR